MSPVLCSFDEKIGLHKTEIAASENVIIADFMLNKTSIQVFVDSSHTFMKCILNQSFLRFLATSVHTLVTQQ